MRIREKNSHSHIDIKLYFSLKKLKKERKSDESTKISHRLLSKLCFFPDEGEKVNTRSEAFEIIKLSFNNLPKSLTGEFFNKTFVVGAVCKVAQSKV